MRNPLESCLSMKKELIINDRGGLCEGVSKYKFRSGQSNIVCVIIVKLINCTAIKEERSYKFIEMIKYIILLLLIIYLYRENKIFKITNYTICSEKISGDTGFVVLADLHNHEYGENNRRLIEAIDRENPDFVLIAGDLLVAKPGYSIEVPLRLLEELSKRYKIYYANGNHEYRLKIYPENYGDMYERYSKRLADLGVILLENENALADYNIRIYGLEIDREYYKRFRKTDMTKEYISSVLKDVNEDEYNILLAHNPKYFDAYAKWGADLTLSGHIHGGLVSLPFLGGIASPQIEFFPKYDAGLFEEYEKKMILSRGLGTHTINIRFNNRAELISVSLKRKAVSTK